MAEQFQNNDVVDLRVAKFAVLIPMNRMRGKQGRVVHCSLELQNDN